VYDEVSPPVLDDLPVADQLIAAWAAGLDARFDLHRLGHVSRLPLRVLRGALADLERRHLVRPAGETHFEFVDEELRGAAARLLEPDPPERPG
jgi:hypothetical protein